MNQRIESIIKISSGADKEALLKMINEHLAKQGVPLYTLDKEDGYFKLLNAELTDEEVDRVDYFCASEIVNSAICLVAELNPNITMHGKLLYNDGYASEIAFVSYDASRRELSVETAHEGDYPACPHCETPSHDFKEIYEMEEIDIPDVCPYCGEPMEPGEYWGGDYSFFKCWLSPTKGWVRTYEVEY